MWRVVRTAADPSATGHTPSLAATAPGPTSPPQSQTAPTTPRTAPAPHWRTLFFATWLPAAAPYLISVRGAPTKNAKWVPSGLRYPLCVKSFSRVELKLGAMGARLGVDRAGGWNGQLWRGWYVRKQEMFVTPRAPGWPPAPAPSGAAGARGTPGNRWVVATPWSQSERWARRPTSNPTPQEQWIWVQRSPQP